MNSADFAVARMPLACEGTTEHNSPVQTLD